MEIGENLREYRVHSTEYTVQSTKYKVQRQEPYRREINGFGWLDVFFMYKVSKNRLPSEATL
jgi:hypothetical protein